MNTLYRVEPLQGQKLVQAYSIVQTIRPSIDYTEWQQHVGELCGGDTSTTPGCGIMGLLGPQDYIYGFYTYRAHRALGFGRTLDVNDFCIAVLAGERAAKMQMLASAEELARLHRCRALDISFLVDEQWHAQQPGTGPLPLEGQFMPAPPSVMMMID